MIPAPASPSYRQVRKSEKYESHWKLTSKATIILADLQQQQEER
jgi:hypothetical protein